MKYLIIKCDELGDQWECDANRTPICMTDDYSKYGMGYEVYELQTDNSLKLIKDYDEANEEGIAIYTFDRTDDDGYPKDVQVLEKYKMSRYDITVSQVQEWIKKYHFHDDTAEDIFHALHGCGEYGESINGTWTVIGEYYDDRYSLGY